MFGQKADSLTEEHGTALTDPVLQYASVNIGNEAEASKNLATIIQTERREVLPPLVLLEKFIITGGGHDCENGIEPPA